MHNDLIPKQQEIIQQAKLLPKEERKNILLEYGELEFHEYLKELFKAMEPNYVIEITHGTEELGKDLVIVKKDKFGIDVIGVIVKIGDIRAKTRGEVDELKTRIGKIFTSEGEKRIEEIESQIQQAFVHPAEIKTIFNKLPISKVIIVLAGEISNQVKKRLRGELEDSVDIFDIEWLIDNFTKYYPQVFFEGKVVDFLQGKIQNLESKHWLSRSGKSLSEYFIEPLVLTVDIPIKLDEEGLALIISKRKIPFLQLKSILVNCKKLILVGDPGVGKSAALSKFTIDMLREAYALAIKRVEKGKKIAVPILISAKEILEIENANSLLKHYFGSLEIINRFQATIMVVDALDEVTPDRRKEIIEKAEMLSKELTCCLVITSRKIEIIDAPPLGFEKYELLPFEFKQAIKLFEKLVSNEKILTALKDGLEKIKFQIPMVPLSLMLLLQLVEEQKEIPASVTELYDRFFDIDLGRYDREKGIEVLFEYYIKKGILAELAYKEFFEKNRLEIPIEEFNEFLNNYAKKYNWERKILESLIKEIERSGILEIKKMVLFRHRSFLEYFAAYYIFDKRGEFESLNDLIVKIYFDEIWGDVAFFYVGLRREISDTLLEKIFEFEKEDLYSYIAKFLAGRLLQAGWNSPSKTKYSGIESAVSSAPKLREKTLNIIEKAKVKIPKIFGDFILMTFSDFSFGSVFLKNEVRTLFDNLLNKQSHADVYKMLLLLWSNQRFMDPIELKDVTTRFLELLSRVSNLSQEEYAVSLIFLMIIQKKGTAISKTIKKKLDKLVKRDPITFKKLLPHKKKGYR